MDNALTALAALGQSPWYDNIDRRIIENGELQRLFDLGIKGVTSNPSIFEKAINASSIYDTSIIDLKKQGKSSLEIYDILTIEDVRAAADLLLPLYKESRGLDGYVSLEVLPEYAHNAAKTIDNARELQKKVARPNLMIKVPGTKEGPEAIRVLTAEGININVTLLFSLKHYISSADAYIQGLTDRMRLGESLGDVCSVASVFISRVDTAVDALLDDMNQEALKGKTAVANAKMIYQKFKECFYGQAFQELSSEGAQRQRVLWGSTSTKNPNYRDVLYVEELVGRDTINTLPHSTVGALLDHGSIRASLEEDLESAKRHLNQLTSLQIDLDQICDRIQEKGVNAFAESFNQLIESIKKKAVA